MLRRTAFLAIIILCASYAVAQGATQKPTAQVLVDMQFHDQVNYYENDDVLVKITITNNTASVYRFRLADTRMFSMDFSVQTLANLANPPSEQYRRMLASNESVFTRDVSLRSGEQFSFVERLNDYKELPAGMYVISSYFYPELRNNAMVQPLVSNRLTLQIRPEIRKERSVEESLQLEVQKLLKAQALAPDQVVAYMLNARMKNNSEQYFLYLDVESLYARDVPRANAWRKMSEIERMNAVDSYRNVLWQNGSDSITPKIPAMFEVLKTSYDDRLAKVEVLVKYRVLQLTEKWLIEYRLEKKDQIWYISNYSPTYKGSE